MPKFRTHYDNLKIQRNAPESVIRAAYKVLIQQYHPDKFSGDPSEALRITKIVKSAYEVLIDPIKRAEHDRWIDENENDHTNKATNNEGFKNYIYNELDLYELAMSEFSSGNVIPGIFGKAIVESNGDSSKLASIYIKLRVKDLLDNIELLYMNQLRSLNCEVIKVFGDLWGNKHWKVTTRQGELFTIKNIEDFSVMIEYCANLNRNEEEQIRQREEHLKRQRENEEAEKRRQKEEQIRRQQEEDERRFKRLKTQEQIEQDNLNRKIEEYKMKDYKEKMSRQQTSYTQRNHSLNQSNKGFLDNLDLLEIELKIKDMEQKINAYKDRKK